MKIPVGIDKIDVVALNMKFIMNLKVRDNITFEDVAIRPGNWFEDSVACGAQVLYRLRKHKNSLRNWDESINYLVGKLHENKHVVHEDGHIRQIEAMTGMNLEHWYEDERWKVYEDSR